MEKGCADIREPDVPVAISSQCQQKPLTDWRRRRTERVQPVAVVRLLRHDASLHAGGRSSLT
eukprot:12198530-Heterocapsa_arctica.AAC.1